MARRSVSTIIAFTPTGTADTTNLVDSTYLNILQGGSGTQLNVIWEIYISGQAASSSSPTPMVLARDSQVGSGSNGRGNGQEDAAIDPATAALAAPAVTGNTNATNKPQRSSTLYLGSCALNAFGGNFFERWNRREEAYYVLGNTAS